MTRASLVIGMVMWLVAYSGDAQAQSVRSLVNGGNSLYKDQKFTDAEVNYRKALEKEQGLIQGHFNLGNSLYKQGKYDESAKEFESAALKADQKDTRGFAYYNIGNAQLKEQKYQDAVKSYVESLKLNPTDQEAKYNLSYALEKLKEQQQQQKNDKNQDKNKNKDKQQDKKDRQQNDKQDQDKQKQDQQKQDQQKQDQQQQDQQKQQQPQQEKQMSKADAQRILDVLKNSEKDVQKKLRAKAAVRPKGEKDW